MIAKVTHNACHTRANISTDSTLRGAYMSNGSVHDAQNDMYMYTYIHSAAIEQQHKWFLWSSWWSDSVNSVGICLSVAVSHAYTWTLFKPQKYSTTLCSMNHWLKSKHTHTHIHTHTHTQGRSGWRNRLPYQSWWIYLMLPVHRHG